MAGYSDTWQDVKVGYTGNGSTPATRVRAFALRVNAGGGKILAIKGYPAGGGKGYSIYPGGMTVTNTGSVSKYGTPVDRDPLDETGGSTLGSNQVIVVMCSLYGTDTDAPPAHGDLFTVTVEKRCDLTITPETRYRGGIVSEEGNPLSVAPLTLAAVGGQAPRETVGSAGLRIVCNGWSDSRMSRELGGTGWKPAQAGDMGVRLSPVRREIVLNWLSTNTVADYTGDGICNVGDWARACRDDFLKTGIIWGRTNEAFIKNLGTYIEEAIERERDMVGGSRPHRDLAQLVSGWRKSHAERTGKSK
jgi:hypothetical protein